MLPVLSREQFEGVRNCSTWDSGMTISGISLLPSKHIIVKMKLSDATSSPQLVYLSSLHAGWRYFMHASEYLSAAERVDHAKYV